MPIVTNLRPRSVEPGWSPIISTCDSLPDWLQNPAAGQPEQAARDALKNSILEKSGIPILRLRTVESGVEEKVAGFLPAWARTAANEEREEANA
ncbi:DUF2726 domain-containing protein [Paraburkholderia caballeronis]|uniref:DUF2726 domain-containing protein n=1 Tax=Paraburkholderia caballeronis TaxID=416943 RepID=UPI0010665CFC|nr:DUF2726 domain-containing protein [Paraburkholderia caballeronis]